MELFITFGLKEIASIIGTLGLNTEIDHLENTIETNGKMFTYEKNGNNLTVKDGIRTLLTVDINADAEESKDYMGRNLKILKHEVNIDYYLQDGTIINLTNNIPLEEGYPAFENVQRHDIMSGLKLKYLNKDREELATFNLSVNKIDLPEKYQSFGFFNEGIVYSNKMITMDGDRLISIGGVDAPTLDVAKDFDEVSERARITKFLNDNQDLHPFTKSVLMDARERLSSKANYAQDVISCYNKDMLNARKAIAIRQNILNGIETFPLNEKDIEQIDIDFRNKVKESVKRKSLTP